MTKQFSAKWKGSFTTQTLALGSPRKIPALLGSQKQINHMKIQLWEWLHPVSKHQIVDDQHLKFPNCFFWGILKPQGSLHFQLFGKKEKDRHFWVRKVALSGPIQLAFILLAPAKLLAEPRHFLARNGPSEFQVQRDVTGGANCCSVRNGWIFFWGSWRHTQVDLKGC